MEQVPNLDRHELGHGAQALGGLVRMGEMWLGSEGQDGR